MPRMGVVWTCLQPATDSLRAHKLRALLAVAGVLAGTAVVIAVTGVIAGLDAQVSRAADEFGTNTLLISKMSLRAHMGRITREERVRRPLTVADAAAIRRHCAGVETVAIEGGVWTSPTPMLRYRRVETSDYELLGVTPEDFLVQPLPLTAGRALTAFDELHRRAVAVVGAELAAQFGGGDGLVGKNIRIDGREFLVVGALGRQAALPGAGARDRTIRLPYSTFRKFYRNERELVILARVAQGQLEAALDEAEGLLRRRRNVSPSQPADFALFTAGMMIEQFRSLTAAIAAAMVVVSGVGLLVGGIGIMNVMLIGVTQRTREIGVRRAVGATRRDIARQFLLEAVLLAVAGGVLGVLAGGASALAIRAASPATPAHVPWWAVAAGVSVSACVGIFFGLWPAVKASRLDPVEALRHE